MALRLLSVSDHRPGSQIATRPSETSVRRAARFAGTRAMARRESKEKVHGDSQVKDTPWLLLVEPTQKIHLQPFETCCFVQHQKKWKPPSTRQCV